MPEHEVIKEVDQPYPYKIKLIKYQKGYGWEISVSGNLMELVIRTIDQADHDMRSTYGSGIDTQSPQT